MMIVWSILFYVYLIGIVFLAGLAAVAISANVRAGREKGEQKNVK